MCANEKYFAIARAIAERRVNAKTKSHYHFGVVGVRKDGLIVSSYNISDPTRQVPEGHAEHRLASKLGQGSEVYVVRLNRQFEDRLSKPCKRCEARLRNQRVNRVYYTIGPNEYGTLVL